MCFFAILVLAMSCHFRDGRPAGFVIISTMSPLRNGVSRLTILLFTRAPDILLPRSECTAYAKSIGVAAIGRSMTSPFGVKAKTRWLKKSVFKVSRYSCDASVSCAWASSLSQSGTFFDADALGNRSLSLRDVGKNWRTHSRLPRAPCGFPPWPSRSEEHTSELQSQFHLVC